MNNSFGTTHINSNRYPLGKGNRTHVVQFKMDGYKILYKAQPFSKDLYCKIFCLKIKIILIWTYKSHWLLQ